MASGPAILPRLLPPFSTASLNDPPLRLLLGSSAARFVEQNDLAKMESDRKWKDLSIFTDFE
jgi:hypothetical protein